MAGGVAYPGALQAVLTRASERALTIVCIKVQNAARQLCPVDTGALRNSITFSVTGSTPESMEGRIGSNLEYALAVENGTGVYGPTGTPITPKNGKVLVFPGKTGTVYTTSVRGQPAKPFLRPALQAARAA